MTRRVGALVAAQLVLCGCTAAQGQVNESILAPKPLRVDQEAVRHTAIAKAVATRGGAIVHPFVWVAKGRTPFKIERSSSGAIVHPAGWMVTLLELVREVEQGAGYELKVKIAGHGEVPAKLVHKDEELGLALIKADVEGELPFIELADSERAVPGEPAVVLSYGEEAKGLMAFCGVLVRASGGTTRAGRRLDARNILLTDAAIRRVNHGGALIDADGRLLGLVDATHVAREVREPTLAQLQAPSFGFVLPAASIRRAFSAAFAELTPQNASLATAPTSQASRTTRVAATAAQIAPSIVGVRSAKAAPELGERDPHATQRRKGSGSGVIIDDNGLVMTNAHLVTGDELWVTLHDGKTLPAKLVRKHAPTNVALLKIRLGGTKVTPIQLGDSSKVIPGETVIGIGRVAGALTLSAGVLSASRSTRRASRNKDKESGNWLQADPTLGNHNGGGALVDMTGRLIGIVDGGRIDKVELAFRIRGDAAKTETNLSFVAGINRLRRAFRSKLDADAGNNATVAVPPAVTAADLATRATPVTRAVKRSGKAVISVYVSWSSKQAQIEDNPFARPEPVILTKGLGSGVIITSDGLAITNWHVVDDATQPTGEMRADHAVHVRLRDGTRYEAKVLSLSREDDLALLQVVVPVNKSLMAIEFGDSDAMRVGDTVIAAGNPEGFANSITVGIVTAKNQGIRIKGRWAKFKGLLQVDAAINGGNSGGPLLDIHGRLVGINTAGGSGRHTTGYAIPVNYVRQKLASVLLSPKKLRSVEIGFGLGDAGGHPEVRTVDRFGPAKRAGFEIGDRLLALDGQPLSWSIGLRRTLLAKEASKPLRFDVRRGGKKLELAVRARSAAVANVFRQTGLECENLSFRTDSVRIRKACSALYERLTGGPPPTIAESLVAVRRVHPGAAADGMQIRVNDLVLGVELYRRSAAGKSMTLRRFYRVADAQNCFNDPKLGKYEGAEFKCWIYRDGKVEVVDLTATRLLF